MDIENGEGEGDRLFLYYLKDDKMIPSILDDESIATFSGRAYYMIRAVCAEQLPREGLIHEMPEL